MISACRTGHMTLDIVKSYEITQNVESVTRIASSAIAIKALLVM